PAHARADPAGPPAEVSRQLGRLRPQRKGHPYCFRCDFPWRWPQRLEWYLGRVPVWLMERRMNDSDENREDWIEGDYVAAVIDDLAEVEAAVTDLGTRGFSSEEMRIYSGRAGSEDLSQLGGEGLLGTIRRALEDYGGAAKDLTDRLEAETARGRHVIVVPLP